MKFWSSAALLTMVTVVPAEIVDTDCAKGNGPTLPDGMLLMDAEWENVSKKNCELLVKKQVFAHRARLLFKRVNFA